MENVIKNQLKNEYLTKEADAWFDRNLNSIEIKQCSFGTEFIKKFIYRQQISKKLKVLEIGSCFGYNLNYLLDNFNNMSCYGIEPSKKAIDYGICKYNKYVSNGRLALIHGTIDELPFDNSFFDIVIIGFCFYQLDRNLLWQSESEVDRVLKEEGFLAITDFNPVIRYKRKNIHNPITPTYKADYAFDFMRMGYSCVEKTTYTASSEDYFPHPVQERVSTNILFKEPLENYYNTLE